MIAEKESLNIQDILRSINILYDAENAQRIAHFQPTSKAVVLIESLLGLRKDKAFFISAPYGSGKSITSTYLLHSIENRKESYDVLNSLHDRVINVSPDAGTLLKSRLTQGNKGIVIALQGYQENLNDAIKQAIIHSLERHKLDSNKILEGLKFNSLNNAIQSIIEVRSKGFDSICIIWDEFGRHIESLIEEGQSSQLNHLQTLAEFASRSDVPFTLGLLLHQNLMNYAGKTPQSVKREWKKIEGRFETIQYIDDSKEIYSLIANVIENIKEDDSEKFISFPQIDVFHQNKLFLEFSKEQLFEIFKKAFPLSPAALFILPKLSSRIAQHERTLFTFLNAVDFKQRIHVGVLYDYFSDAMSQDTAVGGVYHQWSVTESAISKVDDPFEIEVLKTLSLLNVSTAIDKGRVSKDLLSESLQQNGFDDHAISSVVDRLLEKKLLLYRKNTDSITIWHGTEVDLFSRLRDEKDRLSSSFDVIEYIETHFEPTHWKPVEYNNQNKIHRYFRSEYIGFEKLKILISEGIDSLFKNNYDDGRLFFYIPSSDDELKMGKNLIFEEGQHNQILWAIPHNKLDIYDIALEVASYTNMLEDTSLLESDPFIEDEINQLLDDSMEYLQKLVDTATKPSKKGPIFIYSNDAIAISSPRELRNYLSYIMNDVFNLTPILNNEMIVKQNLRSNLVNGRKKLLFAIMDNTGAKDLNLEGFTPDVSMFRSLLLNSGLYRQVGTGEGVDTWVFAKTSEIRDEGLKAVWEELQRFFTTPGEKKQFSQLLDNLKRPPYGLRKGVIPILIASALRAFPSVISITHMKEGYLSDILPSDLEKICESPEEYLLAVESLNDTRTLLLTKLYELFAPEGNISSREMDLIRKTYDAIEMWKSNLPEASMTSRRISQDTRIFQEIIRSIKDPRNTFFQKIPSKFNSTDIDYLFSAVKKSKEELEGITEAYYDLAAKSILSTLQMPSLEISGVSHAVGTWVTYLPDELFKRFKDSIAKALLVRLRMPYEDHRLLIDSVAGLLIGKPVSKWDDSTFTVFEREFQENIHRIEDYVLNHTPQGHKGKAHMNLANLALTRIDSLYRKVCDLIGDEEEARRLINEKLNGGI